ncbi:MAG TPA: DUF559 domain-containing protein [Candidatus Corynebacterium avicola]|uniref:DUF559 domain-containing protein n=1 Tax=Candidatus Corynebacterium avicola TaxID=2838527 RepID=A0A9D1UKU4_9CORY|nr:DUF559 domain-containing protein [Candidatus Corynebacterium avicola]
MADTKLYRVERGLYCSEEPDDRRILHMLAWNCRGLHYVGSTAAFLWGITEMRWPAHARVPRGKGHHGGRLLTLSTGASANVRMVNSVPAVSPIETAVQCPYIGRDKLRRFLARAYNGVKGTDELTADLLHLPPRDREAATDLIDGLIVGTASDLERTALRGIVKAVDGLDVTIEVNTMILGYRFDVVIPEAKVCIEIDSRRYHSARSAKPEDFVKDRWKGNTVVRFGWTLLRYPEESVLNEADAVTEQVRDTVIFNLGNPRTRKERDAMIRTDHPVWTWHSGFKAFNRSA